MNGNQIKTRQKLTESNSKHRKCLQLQLLLICLNLQPQRAAANRQRYIYSYFNYPADKAMLYPNTL